MKRSGSAKLTILPLTPERWPDLEAVFGARGCSIARSCWCMAYRVSGGAKPLPAGQRRSEVNRGALKRLVDSGSPPGLLAYRDGVPVGWVSLGPREEFAKLQRSPVMKPVDDRPVWSIICFVVPPAYRKQGVAHALLRGAVAYARAQGATLLEAYPVDRKGRQPDENLWFGPKSMYDRAGFRVVARRKAARPVMRRRVP